MRCVVLLLCLAWVGLGVSELLEEPLLEWDDEQTESTKAVKGGTDVDLHCSATGVPPPTIRWFKDGVALGVPTAHLDEARIGNEVEQVANDGVPTMQTATTKSTLTIPCVAKDSAGVYTCQASNGILTSLRRNLTLDVEAGWSGTSCPKSRRSESLMEGGEAARIQMWTDFRIERDDAMAQLFCRATGTPTPTIRWFMLDEDLKPRQEITKYNPGFFLLHNGDLLVNPKANSDQGGFNFLCEARNKYGIDSKTISFMELSMGDADEVADYADNSV